MHKSTSPGLQILISANATCRALIKKRNLQAGTAYSCQRQQLHALPGCHLRESLQAGTCPLHRQASQGQGAPPLHLGAPGCQQVQAPLRLACGGSCDGSGAAPRRWGWQELTHSPGEHPWAAIVVQGRSSGRPDVLQILLGRHRRGSLKCAAGLLPSAGLQAARQGSRGRHAAVADATYENNA